MLEILKKRDEYLSLLIESINIVKKIDYENIHKIHKYFIPNIRRIIEFTKQYPQDQPVFEEIEYLIRGCYFDLYWLPVEDIRLVWDKYKYCFNIAHEYFCEHEGRINIYHI